MTALAVSPCRATTQCRPARALPLQAKGIDAAWRMALDGAVDAARDPVLSALEIVVGADPGGSPPRGNPLSPVLRAVQASASAAGGRASSANAD